MINQSVPRKLKNSYFSYFLMFNFYYFAWAVFSALTSVYLMGKGFNATEVSFIVSASFLSSMITQPFIGIASDRFGIKRINIILFVLAAAGGVFFIFADSFITILIGYSFVLLLLNGTNPMIEKTATASPYEYGKIRIWGTIGYAMGSQAAGLIYDYISPSAVFITFVITIVISTIGVFYTNPKEAKPISLENKEQSKISTLFTNRKFIYYLCIYGIFTGLTSMANTYIPTMFTSEGLSASTASVILSLAVLCELPIVFYSSRYMDRFSNKVLMITAIFVTLLQFLSYSVSLPLVLQIITTFMAKHTMGMLFIMVNLKAVNTLVEPHHQITALAFAATIKNLMSIVFQTVGGTMIDSLGYHPLFLISSIAMIICLIMTALFKIPSGNDLKLFSGK